MNKIDGKTSIPVFVIGAAVPSFVAFVLWLSSISYSATGAEAKVHELEKKQEAMSALLLSVKEDLTLINKGVKETKEALVGFIKLAAMLATEFKDGVQATDIAPIVVKMQSEPLKSALLDAYNGIDEVPSELKDLSLVEALSLVPEMIDALSELVKAVKK
jgi:hypothetical protein